MPKLTIPVLGLTGRVILKPEIGNRNQEIGFLASNYRFQASDTRESAFVCSASNQPGQRFHPVTDKGTRQINVSWTHDLLLAQVCLRGKRRGQVGGVRLRGSEEFMVLFNPSLAQAEGC